MQATFLLLTSTLPVTVNLGLILSGARPDSVFPLLVNAAFSWMPLANAVTALCFYTPYRRFLLRKFGLQQLATVFPGSTAHKASSGH